MTPAPTFHHPAARGLLEAALALLFLPLWPLGRLSGWRARRRLRSYGPPAILALRHLPRLGP